MQQMFNVQVLGGVKTCKSQAEAIKTLEEARKDLAIVRVEAYMANSERRSQNLVVPPLNFSGGCPEQFIRELSEDLAKATSEAIRKQRAASVPDKGGRAYSKR